MSLDNTNCKSFCRAKLSYSSCPSASRFSRDVEGVTLRMNGAILTTRSFEQMPAYSQYEQTIHVSRASNKYNYDFKLGFRSSCDRQSTSLLNLHASRLFDLCCSIAFLVTGTWPPSQFQSEEVSLSATFLEACSTVDWAGYLKRNQAFTINSHLESGLLEVKVSNPEGPERSWASNDRLDAVVLEYRRQGDVGWRSARLDNGSVVDFALHESNYGFASLFWDVASIPDGDYEIRTSTLCKAAGLDPPEGINLARSTTIAGRVDRSAPTLFSHAPEPADGVFNPGDAIAVDLSEEVDCSRPFNFDISLNLGGSITATKSSLDIVCSGRRIEISLVNRFAPSTLAGSVVSISLSNVRDKAGNVMTNPIAWAFSFPSNSALQPSRIVLRNIRFAIPFNSTWSDARSAEFVAMATQLSKELSTLLAVDIKRIKLTKLKEASDGMTLVTLTIVPVPSDRRRSDDKSADEISLAFLALFEGNNTAMFGNSSLLGTMDLSALPVQEVEQSAALPTPARRDNTEVSSSESETSLITSESLSVKLFVIIGLVLAQGLLLIGLCYKTRTNATKLSQVLEVMTRKPSNRSRSAIHLPSPLLSGKVDPGTSDWVTTDLDAAMDDNESQDGAAGEPVYEIGSAMDGNGAMAESWGDTDGIPLYRVGSTKRHPAQVEV